MPHVNYISMSILIQEAAGGFMNIFRNPNVFTAGLIYTPNSAIFPPI